MSGRSIEDQIARLDALKSASPSPETIAQLGKALESKSSILVTKAAKMVGILKLSALEDSLTTAFHRLIESEDKGCLAKTAIVKTLADMEISDDAVYLVGARHVQMEPTWGGSTDAAVELRCESVAALVRMNSRKMWEPIVHLLADADPQARATAARALGATGNEKAIVLLQYKILIGDKEPSVMGECFGSIITMTRSIELVKPFLDSREESLVEAAVLALGESRLPESYHALVETHRQNFAANRRLLLLAIAMTRQPDAIDYLLSVLNEDAIEALKMYRSDSVVREKIRAAAQKSPALVRAFEKHFGAT